MPTPRLRLRACSLALLFLVGALGMPVADGLLFHRAGCDPYAGVTHLEPLGSTHHAERCALQAPAMAQREGLGSTRAIRVAPPLFVRTTPAIAAAPVPAELITLRHSRAPPA